MKRNRFNIPVYDHKYININEYIIPNAIHHSGIFKGRWINVNLFGIRIYRYEKYKNI